MSSLLSSYNQILKSKPLLVTSLTTGVCYSLGDFIAQTIEIKENKKNSYCYYRLCVMSIYGTIFGGPLYYAWFSKIERMPKLLQKIATWNEKRTLVQHFSRELSERMNSNSLSDMSMTVFRNNYKETFNKMETPLIRSKTILVAKIYADQFLFSPLYIIFFMMSTGVMMDTRNYNLKEPILPQLTQSFKQTFDEIRKKFINIYVADCAVWPLAQMANFAFVPSHLQPIFVNIVNVAWNTFLSYASLGH